jgi:5-methylcytosine-specific restriction endonuclease McrA
MPDKQTEKEHRKTEQEHKEYYQQKSIVDIYEQRRFGNIKRSLAHWLDCDAIEYLVIIKVLALDYNSAHETRII